MEPARRGIRFHDVGESTFRDSPFRILTPREKAIAYFKRGIGIRSYPWKKWIYFDDAAEEDAYIQESQDAYRRHLAVL